ncbi:GntR family transcriptional regulator [Mesobacillus campisalis]|uniref:GntR family transcriptional regulator n=1 Tax=Mesobacillus campisalis TaxID=1408103 RepID=A0A0M2SXJ9_9BACI|nr:PLP-dependent aminotransferase family protein [Mesobacillus campisalis]KKK37712.1 GntR family transcriptional regulator [Mesobacillus campisalis]
MELQIIFTDERPKYIQIYQAILKSILEKSMPPHHKLPSKRNLAQQLNVSIMTVQLAYEQLQSEGYIYSVERQGYFASAMEEDWQYAEKPSVQPKESVGKEIGINFKNGQVDAGAFPYKQWLRLYKKQLQVLDGANAPWQGEDALRVQIAYYLQQARGLECQPEQIYVFSGFQQQLLNLCLFFKRPAVGMEEPGFMRARSVFEQLQLNCSPVPVDGEGCSVPDETVKLLYTTPAHQYPTGVIMSASRRMQLLNWASQQGSYILEDDYDSEFRYAGAPIATLSHLDHRDCVFYFGTFSKTLLPSLRISYMVVPASLTDDFEEFNAFQKSTVSRIDQLAVSRFMEEGFYAKHIAKMRTLYRAKRNCLIHCITEYLGEEFKVKGDSAGLHIILGLPEGLEESDAVERAKEAGVMLDRASTMYQLEKPRNHIMIGYGAPSMDEISFGVEMLARVWNPS